MACVQGTFTHSVVGKSPANLCVTQSTSDVAVSINVSDSVVSFDGRFDWTMELQRYEGGKWNIIGTRSGYVYASSPSHRTFTNVAKKNAKTRVVLFAYDASKSTATSQVLINTFTR